jgi:hypothetical protein
MRGIIETLWNSNRRQPSEAEHRLPESTNAVQTNGRPPQVIVHASSTGAGSARMMLSPRPMPTPPVFQRYD